MKKIFIILFSILALLIVPSRASAAPVMLSMFGGPDFAVGIMHKSELGNLREEMKHFAIDVGCEPTNNEAIIGTYRNYMADHPVNTPRPSAEWLQGLGKAVGADYVALFYSDISGLHAGSIFHNSPKMTVHTDMRIVKTSSGETILTCQAPEREGKREEVLKSVPDLIAKAKFVIKQQGIVLK